MNFLKQISLLVLAACLGMVLVGCQPSDPNSPRVAQLTSIAVTPSAVNLEIGGVQALTVTGTYSNGTTHVVNFDSTFVSSAPAIARVDPNTGYVTALAEGNATITATTSGKSATASVTVAPLRVISVAVSPATSALTVGATQALTVTATYNNTTTGPVTADSTFVSLNPDVATVDAAGIVTAVAEGSATITATHTATDLFASATVTVSATAGGGDFTTITFDEPGVAYTLTGFGGAEDATTVPDPAGGANTVARVVKSATAELWAGTTVSTGPNLSVGTIPFTATATRMTVRVYSTRAGYPVRLKVEDAADVTHTVETEAVTTVANGWETLTFDFANQAAGTAALNPAYTYNKLSIFFDFGTTGAAGGGGTFYFDDVTFTGDAGGGGGFATITFDQAGVTYTLTGFGGAEDATTVPDPVGGANTVARVVKSATAELWAGTTVSTGPNLSVGTIPFTATATRMTVRVYSTRAGYPVRLKAEDAADPGRSVETEAVTTVADAWETLTFDFANQVAGTAALNPAYTYNKLSIFFDFGTTGAAGGGGTFYFDDVTFTGDAGGGGGGSFTTITFDQPGVTYTLTGFGGAEDATTVADPAGGANTVARVVKSATAELWAGTTVSTGPNLSVDTIPFTATATRMTVRVYSTRAGYPVRLKVEDAADVTHSVETEAVTTVANAWETLTFNFANQAAGTAALNLAYTYNKVSIFFDFGTTGAAGGGGTFYFDDVAFD